HNRKPVGKALMERPLATKTTERNGKSSLFPFFFRRFPATGGIDSRLPQPSIARELSLSVQIPFRAFREFPSIPLFLFSLDLLLAFQIQDTSPKRSQDRRHLSNGGELSQHSHTR